MSTLRRHRLLLAVAALVAVSAFVTAQVVTNGPLVALDYRVHYLRFDIRFPRLYDLVWYSEIIGQRGPTAIVALIAAGRIARRLRSWRPIVVIGVALVALNLLVGGLKLATARLRPLDGSAAVFVDGGIIFPSGHAANVVVTWGILTYVMVEYGPARRYRGGVIGTIGASLLVGLGSIYLDTHWLSDILAGWSIGAFIVLAVAGLDHHQRRSRQRSASSSITGANAVAEYDGAMR